jgi:hypothetical protein
LSRQIVGSLKEKNIYSGSLEGIEIKLQVMRGGSQVDIGVLSESLNLYLTSIAMTNIAPLHTFVGLKNQDFTITLSDSFDESSSIYCKFGSQTLLTAEIIEGNSYLCKVSNLLKEEYHAL